MKQLFKFLMILGGISYATAQNAITYMYAEQNNGSLFANGSASGTQPNHNLYLVGFRYNNLVYSTGVNDKLLSDNHISFVPAKIKALAVTDRALTRNAKENLVCLPAMLDGSASIIKPTNYNNGLGLTTPARLKTLLEDGKKGLNITTGYANITAGDPIIVPIDFSMSPTSINDGIPDILISQIASPEGKLDKLKFVDEYNNTIGTEISFDFSKASISPALATYRVDIFYPDN